MENVGDERDGIQVKPTRKFTRTFHDMTNSAAYLTISDRPRTMLGHFQVQWEKAEYGRQEPLRSIPFAWTGYPYPCARDSFDKARNELVSTGFLAEVSKGQARYAPSEAWRSYTPSMAERDKIEAHSDRRKAQREVTKQSRAARASTGRKSRTAIDEAVKRVLSDGKSRTGNGAAPNDGKSGTGPMQENPTELVDRDQTNQPSETTICRSPLGASSPPAPLPPVPP